MMFLIKAIDSFSNCSCLKREYGFLDILFKNELLNKTMCTYSKEKYNKQNSLYQDIIDNKYFKCIVKFASESFESSIFSAIKEACFKIKECFNVSDYSTVQLCNNIENKIKCLEIDDKDEIIMIFSILIAAIIIIILCGICLFHKIKSNNVSCNCIGFLSKIFSCCEKKKLTTTQKVESIINNDTPMRRIYFPKKNHSHKWKAEKKECIKNTITQENHQCKITQSQTIHQNIIDKQCKTYQN